MSQTVLTLGTFDLFHRGHVELLRRCAEIAGPSGRVVVGLNTDYFVWRYKGATPVLNYPDREAVLAACRYVDEVRPNAQADGSIRDVLYATRPHIIVVGADWAARDYLVQIGITTADLAATGTVVQYVPYTSGISSSDIKRRLLA